MMQEAPARAAFLFGSTAHAQVDEPKTETKVENAEGKEKPEPDVDPSRHFNYANFSYSGKDEYGGVFGDGKEQAPEGAAPRRRADVAAVHLHARELRDPDVAVGQVPVAGRARSSRSSATI